MEHSNGYTFVKTKRFVEVVALGTSPRGCKRILPALERQVDGWGEPERLRGTYPCVGCVRVCYQSSHYNLTFPRPSATYNIMTAGAALLGTRGLVKLVLFKNTIDNAELRGNIRHGVGRTKRQLDSQASNNYHLYWTVYDHIYHILCILVTCTLKFIKIIFVT